MTPSDAVCAGQSPVPDPLQRLGALIAASPHNLVSSSEREHVLTRHVVQSLRLAQFIAPRGRWMDLGTGGGLPGLVLAWRFPAVAWTLVDATAKKAEAVRQFADALGLSNVSVVQARAELLAWDAEHRGRYDGVVARALAPLPTLTELARGFLAPAGHLVAVKGPTWRQELRDAHAALQILGYHNVHSELVAGEERETWVVTMQAHGPPPPGFPRPDGIPKHNPLR